jgi:hypothetical protein
MGIWVRKKERSVDRNTEKRNRDKEKERSVGIVKFKDTGRKVIESFLGLP